jgi:hypothetical protein
MGELEAREGVYSLEFGFEIGKRGQEFAESAGWNENTPYTQGAYTDSRGRSWAADLSLTEAPLDISKMNLEWVAGTDDPLFSDLSRRERHLLYLYFAKDMSWADMAESLGMRQRGVKALYQEVLTKLRDKVSGAGPADELTDEEAA